MVRSSIFICILFPTMVLAGPNENHFFLGLSAGPTWATGNKNQTFNLQPDVIKTYQAKNDSSIFPSAELFLGRQRWVCISPTLPLVAQFGLEFAAAGQAKLHGDIWEDADPTFDNYTYHYKINHTHVGLKVRFVGRSDYLINPYFNAMIGAGFNHAYDFTINPKIPEEVAAPAFKSKTMNAFSYALGAGLQMTLNAKWQAAVGYEFADWGRVQLGRAPGQTVNQGLQLDHLYAHQLQFSLFYSV